MSIRGKLTVSLKAASRFIVEHRHQSGFWSDFLTLAGESVYWVSGYTGYALTSWDAAHVEGLLRESSLSLIENQGKSGGWGYGLGVPPDADSTSWCVLLLSRLGYIGSEVLERASTFLMRHQNPDGGFRTYGSPVAVGRYMGLDGSVSFKGWQSSQLCVTGVAVKALIEAGWAYKVSNALNFIREAQSEEGFWNPYWWNDALYSTVNCMWALKSTNTDGEALDQACGWIKGTQLPDGGWSDASTECGVAFSTALALKGLLLEPRLTDSESIQRGVKWLLSQQQADGGWPSYYLLRIPFPSMMEPWRYHAWVRDGKAIGAVIRDHRRLFTTATAFSALSMFDRRIRGEES